MIAVCQNSGREGSGVDSSSEGAMLASILDMTLFTAEVILERRLPCPNSELPDHQRSASTIQQERDESYA